MGGLSPLRSLAKKKSRTKKKKGPKIMGELPGPPNLFLGLKVGENFKPGLKNS